MKIMDNYSKIIENTIFKYYEKNYNFTFKTQKYTLSTIITGIFYVLRTGIAWHDYNGYVNGKTLYYHYNRFSKAGIFKIVYKILLKKYLSKDKNKKLRYQFIDSTFIANINGIDKIGRNRLLKNKKVSKISAITDVNGIPLSLILKEGNRYDSEMYNENMQLMLIDVSKRKKYKKYFLAD